MKLKFLGNGSGFNDTHTGAYFQNGDNIIFIDCSMLNVIKMVELSKNKQNVFVYMTHLHADHSSGLGLFIQYLYYTQGRKKLNIVSPLDIIDDVKTLLKITGISLEICNVISAENCYIDDDVKLVPILTHHAPELKCFGYQIQIKDDSLVYTGDTCNLADFKNEIDNCSELYCDISASYCGVHLKYDDVKDELKEIAKTKSVYIMHIDNEELMKELIQDTNIEIAKIAI